VSGVAVIRSAISGSAAAIALPTAAGELMVPDSPTPFAPPGVTDDGVCWWTMSMFTEPALACGVVYESGLAEQIAADASGGPGGLPLMAFALARLWESQRGRRIGFAEYRRFGGVAGAVDEYAERVYDALRGRGASGADEGDHAGAGPQSWWRGGCGLPGRRAWPL
jgi:hypothetical protein